MSHKKSRNDDPSIAADAADAARAALAAAEGGQLLAKAAPQAPPIMVRGIAFDLDDAELPKEIKDHAFQSGGYPYSEGMKRKEYDSQLTLLQIELVKLQRSVNASGRRIVLLFEGRDAAGKGGTIEAIKADINPRSARSVALPKPSDIERGQWYFQRYAEQLPSAGEIVLFDRSWYNRAGVERVLGFATPEQVASFMEQAPRFEQMLVEDGIILVKYYLDIGREMQLKRFHDRRHNALKIWKLSPIDIKALGEWEGYSAARDDMIERTHSVQAPWTLVRANDKRRAHLNAIRHLLLLVDYEDRSLEAIGPVDHRIIGSGPRFPLAS